MQFIAAVVPERKLLILDEPFTGLDPVSADTILNAILTGGATVILSAHEMAGRRRRPNDPADGITALASSRYVHPPGGTPVSPFIRTISLTYE